MQPARPLATVDLANPAAFRQEFPLLATKTYLNSGSYCALANRVEQAVAEYLGSRLAVGANWDLWIAKNEAVRSAMARLLGCSPDEVAVTTSASAGLNALASTFDFRGARNRVVVSDFEFPTNAQIWHAQSPRGAEVVHVQAEADGTIPLANFEAAIDENTALVAITHVCYRNGARLDIPGIVRIAKARGARVLVDCYQSAGALDVDVRALGVDFAVGGMMKYLLGTAGIGWLYVREELIEGLIPTHSGWFAQEDIFAMDIRANTPSHTARRFEAGTPPIMACFMAEAGLSLLLEVGAARIEKRIAELTSRCIQELRAIEWPTSTPQQWEAHGPTVCIPSVDSSELVRRLSVADIVTSNRGVNVRASFHYYNSEADIRRLIEVLSENRELRL